VELPYALRESLHQTAEEYSLADLKQAVSHLTEVYQRESGADKRLVFRDVDVAAYALTRMPATFAAVSAAFSACRERSIPQIFSVLDVGAGMGTASWAIRSLLDAEISFICLEREETMIRLGRKLAARDTLLQKIRWLCVDDTQKDEFPEADLVMASYTLNELSQENQTLVLNKLWKATKKLLLLVETGTPTGSCVIRNARDALTKENAYIVAPCPGNGPCPMEGDDWCHFSARIARSRVHKMLKDGDAPFEDEKFSYIAFARTPVEPAHARILRHPIKESGCITLKLCTDGGTETQSIHKGQKERFRAARKANAGDEFQ